MDNLLISTLFKVLLPSFAVAVMLIAAKKRRLSFATDIGIQRPKSGIALAFLIGWVCLIAIEEMATSSMAGASAKHWPDFPIHIIALRILAIGIIGPIAEELAFRGLIMAMIRKTRLGVVGAILVAAVSWSALHFGYSAPLLLLVLLDGIVLGSARYFSRSLWVPIGMHITGNMFSIWQSLS